MAVWWLQKHSPQPILWAVCILILTFFIGACTGSTLSESKYLLQFIQAIDPKNQSIITLGGSAHDICSSTWMGIKCDNISFHITEIRLENLGLSGTIDSDALCRLPYLRVLSLPTNRITGVIPDSISNCRSLVYLNLSNNILHGRLPQSLNNLENLRSLDISKNNLIGPLPSFKQDIVLVYPKSMKTSTANNQIVTIYYHTSIVSFIVLLVSMSTFSFFIYIIGKKFPTQTKAKENDEYIRKSPVGDLTSGAKIGETSKLVLFCKTEENFDFDDLLKSAADLRGQNIYSSLYVVRLRSDTILAVKRLKILHVSGDDFRQNISWIGNLKHPNLLPLVAYHSSAEEKLLVYEYQKSGSLSFLLSSHAEGKIDLPWRQRLSIMNGIARGMDYVARESHGMRKIPHGNIKPSNILLGENGEPLISEFGIWSLLDPKKMLYTSSHGYRAPEKKLTMEADVFSLGVILLELLTGKIAEKSGMDLPRWVKSMVREEWTGEVFDREVRTVGRQWAFPLLNVALKCVSDVPEQRPHIAEILEKIGHTVNSQKDDWSFSSPSSVESNQQDHHSLIQRVVPETTLESPQTG